MIARRIAYSIATLVILSSGAYLFVYLYRWEWNRALIAGVILLVAEVAVASMLILERLTKLEKRMDERSPQAETLGHLRETAPPPKARFKWLAGDGEMHVFIPVLMGAGILFSGVAWVIERVARVSARPALEYGLALRLQSLALPQGGFLAPAVAPQPVPKMYRRHFKTAFVALVIAGAVMATIDQISDLTQNRPHLDKIEGDTAEVRMHITRKGWVRSETAAARSLWFACMQTVSPAFDTTGFRNEGGGYVTMLISPALGESAERRLMGCLEDTTLDNTLARVISFTSGSK